MICAMIGWSLVILLTRAAKESHFLQLEITSAVQSVYVWVPLYMLCNQYLLHNEFVGDIGEWTFDVRSVCVMITVGVLGFTALCLNVVGFQQADATKIGWMGYINILFCYMYQSILFGEVLNGMEIVGIVFVVIASSLTILEEWYKAHGTSVDDDAQREYDELRDL